jgi:hypothetical protein
MGKICKETTMVSRNETCRCLGHEPVVPDDETDAVDQVGAVGA